MATLYVVATPIGNLEDLSPRAVRVLGEVQVVAAEGVTRTRKLLSHLGLKGKKLVSCREANREGSAGHLVGLLDQGLDVALVSDAGTPGVSDPGAVLVRRAAEAGHKVCPVPGPSALAAALSVAGLEPSPLVMLGFPPAKHGPRLRLLMQAGATGWPMVIYESPHRLAATAADLLEALGDRPLVVCREVSKVHEEIVRTTCGALARAAADEQARGEITLVVSGGQMAETPRDDLEELLAKGLEEGKLSPSKLAREIARQTGKGREEIYKRLMELKQG